MFGKTALVGCLLFGACNKSEGGDSLGSAMTTSATKSGSGGFSADLAKEMGVAKGSAGSGSATKPVETVGSGSAMAPPAAGSAKVPDKEPTLPDKAPAVPDKTPAVPDKTAMAGSAKAPDKAPATPDKAPATPDKAPAIPDKTPAAPDKTPAPPVKLPQTPVVEPAHGTQPAQVPANLAAIKISLLPNWDRDIGDAGTFQYVVRIKGSTATKTFVFHYGYDDPRAPSDREQYKKFLVDNTLMTGELRDRQRGGAWFLEGADANGSPAFRYVVLFGGKRLICYGSLYKDAESNKLGDDRDQTVIQAKQICESMAL